MRKNRGLSFKKVLKLAKKTFKRSKSRRHSQSDVRRRKQNKRGGFKLDQDFLQEKSSQNQKQQGGSGVGGGKEGATTLADSAAPVV
jgi:hypothetical protein